MIYDMFKCSHCKEMFEREQVVKTCYVRNRQYYYCRTCKRKHNAKELGDSRLYKVGKRKCYTCKKIFDLDILNFTRSSKSSGGLVYQCRRCERLNRKKYSSAFRLSKYGLTPERLQRLTEKQSGMCAICKIETDKLSVDHDHNTGVVRGLLCHHCNVGIGFLRDDIETLSRAISYLKQS